MHLEGDVQEFEQVFAFAKYLRPLVMKTATILISVSYVPGSLPHPLRTISLNLHCTSRRWALSLPRLTIGNCVCVCTCTYTRAHICTSSGSESMDQNLKDRIGEQSDADSLPPEPMLDHRTTVTFPTIWIPWGPSSRKHVFPFPLCPIRRYTLPASSLNLIWQFKAQVRL